MIDLNQQFFGPMASSKFVNHLRKLLPNPNSLRGRGIFMSVFHLSLRRGRVLFRRNFRTGRDFIT